MEKWRGIIIASIAGMVLVLAIGKYFSGKTNDYDYGGIVVDERAVTRLLRNSQVMQAGNYSREVNAQRLKNATRQVRDKIFIRLAHFNNARVQMDCDKKVKDIMIGVAEGLRDAGIIDDARCAEEMDSIETMGRSGLFPNLVPVNFCDLAK